MVRQIIVRSSLSNTKLFSILLENAIEDAYTWFGPLGITVNPPKATPAMTAITMRMVQPDIFHEILVKFPVDLASAKTIVGQRIQHVASRCMLYDYDTHIWWQKDAWMTVRG